MNLYRVRCPICGRSLEGVLHQAIDEDAIRLDMAPPHYVEWKEKITCPGCSSEIMASLEAEMDLNLEVRGLKLIAAHKPPAKVVAEFFAKKPSDYVFWCSVNCECCGNMIASLGKTAKDLMESGHRVAQEFPVPRVTCPKCASIRLQRTPQKREEGCPEPTS